MASKPSFWLTGGRVKKTLRLAAIGMLFLLICADGYAQERNRIHIGDDVLVEIGEEVGTAVSIGGDVRVYGTVRDGVISVGGSVFLGPEAVVHGDVTTIGGMVVKQEGAIVSGDINTCDTTRITSFFERPPPSSWKEDRGTPFMPGMFPFLGFLALALIVVALLPEKVDLISSTIRYHTGISLLWGVIGTLLIFPVALVLVISLVGIILIPLEILVVFIAFFLGSVAVARIIGERIIVAIKKSGSPMVIETLVGSVVLWATGLIPVVGWMVISAAAVIGFGGFIAGFIHRRRHHAETGRTS